MIPAVARARIDVHEEELADFCRRNHIRRLALFGSVLREDFTANSDVDVLVELQDGHILGLGFFRIQDELSRLFERSVDLHTPGFLNPRLRQRVLRQAALTYDAAIHGYDSVDLDILWEIVASDLPALIAALAGSNEERAKTVVLQTRWARRGAVRAPVARRKVTRTAPRARAARRRGGMPATRWGGESRVAAARTAARRWGLRCRDARRSSSTSRPRHTTSSASTTRAVTGSAASGPGGVSRPA